MNAKEDIRKRLLERIRKLPEDKLGSVAEFIDKLEHEIRSKEAIMDYSGLFKDLDPELFKDFTEDLHKNRNQGENRIP